MKKNIVLKIVLMLIIMVSIFLAKMPSVMAWSGSWTGNASDVATSSNVFCRDYNGPLPYQGPKYTYITDGATTKYYDDQYQYAYIFNFLTKTGATISASPAQKAFWNTSKGGNKGPNYDYSTGYNNYIQYHNRIKAYKSNDYKPTVDISKARYDATTRTYGPIKISYPSWDNNNYGLKFTVEANGRIITPTINYDGSNLNITFTQDQINQGISKATLKINYSYLSSCWAEITPIKANSSASTEPVLYLCEEHKDIYSVDTITNFDPNSNKLYKISQDPTYVYILTSDLVYDENYQMKSDYYIENGHRYLKRANPPIGENGLAGYYQLIRLKCDKEKMGSQKCGQYVNADALQKLVWVDYGINTGSGHLDDINIQLIPTINLNIAKYNSIIETKLGKDANSLQGTGLNGASFNVQAYQVGTDGTIYDNLSIKNENGVQKIIPASKDYNPEGWEKYSKNRKQGDIVYILVTEKNAPKGYKVLNQPICILYKLIYNENAKIYEWYPSYAPKDWTDVLGQNRLKWYKWEWNEEKDPNKNYDFPNAYKTSFGDNIMVEEVNNNNNNNIYLINVFDEAVVEELTLLKVDADNNNSALNGAEFKATFENVKEFKFGNNKISTETPFVFTVNGSITIKDVVYIDETKPIKITLEEINPPPAQKDYYYKKLEGPITITIEHTPKNGLKNGTVTYNGTETINNTNLTINEYKASLTIPNLRLIDLSGFVWLDGNTGIKPVIGPDGKYTNGEKLVSNVLVELTAQTAPFSNETLSYTSKTINTNTEGKYSFKGLRWNKDYFVTFNYDGVHYIASNGKNYSGAIEPTTTNGTKKSRLDFNNNFKIIKYGQTGTGIALSYEYNSDSIKAYGINARTSTLQTLQEVNLNGNGKLYPIEIDNRLEMGSVKSDFNITANTPNTTYTKHANNLNLGIVKRGADLALSTNVYTADVSINGQTTTYNYDLTNQDNLQIDLTKNNLINSNTSNENYVDYALNLYATDYSYRMRDYKNSDEFVKDYEAEIAPSNTTTGNELEVYVTYTLQIENQLKANIKVNKIRYNYDDRYSLSNIYYIQNGQRVYLNNNEYNLITNQKSFDITKNIEFSDYGVKTLYIEFKVTNFDLLNSEYSYCNEAEITEYETEEGLIDLDSEPGNVLNDLDDYSYIEDDYDEANGITIKLKDETRKISGYVWEDADNDGKQNNSEKAINDVIVQLIELKNVEGRNYEYIWQETKSGSKNVKSVSLQRNADGKFVVQNYSHNEEILKGQYKFEGFIPGDYIVRFIYGDGTTKDYGLTDEMVKYNGQDYKSTIEPKYSAQWYNNAEYGQNENTSRDNEARRLETMAWSTNVDAKKGVLLKLLDLQTEEQRNKYVTEDLSKNNIEKSIIINTYNENFDPDITDVTAQNIKDLQVVTLANTWMCAETAKIKVPVESEDLKGVTTTINVNGVETEYKYEFKDIALGLSKRPQTEIKLEKHLKSMVITTSNGQTLLNAYVKDENNMDGKTDGLQTIPGTGWIFSVSPTDVNTLIDGANLEFTYEIVVKNTGETDTLSGTLIGEYNDPNVTYADKLKVHAGEVKLSMRSVEKPYTLGTYLGTAYYKGGTDSKVQTEVTSIYDYVNNDLTLIDAQNMTNKGGKDHYLLNEKYEANNVLINTVLEAEPTGKMNPGNTVNKYIVKLGKNPLSSSGTLDFTNYIAEVMSYTNAAGRRTVNIEAQTPVTPGNAEAVNKNINPNMPLELDEASMEEVKIQPALGEDKNTTYIWWASIVAGIVIIAVGAFVTKKYIMK